MTVLASGSLFRSIKGEQGNQEHDVRNIIESLEGYAVKNGIDIQYTDKYTFKDIVIIADQASGRWNTGVSLSNRVKDVAINGAKVDGFIHPFTTGTVFKNKPDKTDVVFVNVSVEGSPLDPATDIHNPDVFPNVISNYAPAFHSVLTTENLNLESLEFEFLSSMSYELPETLNGPSGFMVTGTKKDSAGTKLYSSFWSGWTMLRPILEKGYYTRADASKYIVLIDLVADRLTGKVIPIEIEADIIHDYWFLGPNLGTNYL